MDHAPRKHAHSEATRLLCAGAWLDAAFRRRVIDELVGHAERPVPPSLGVDVRPVLAHALRARRQEVRTALTLLAVWIGFFLSSVTMIWDAADDVTGGYDVSVGDAYSASSALDASTADLVSSVPVDWSELYAGVVLALWAGRALAGRPTLTFTAGRGGKGVVVSGARKVFGRLVTYAARVLALVYWFHALRGVADDPYPVIFPLLIAAVVWLHRIRVTTVLRRELSRETFAETPPPDLPPGERYRRIGEAVDREQHALGTLYDVNRPFLGSGVPHQPWSLALELQRKDDGGLVPTQKTVPLSGRDVIDMIRPRLSALRDSAARTSRDRLREMELDELVFLPSGAPREAGVYTEQSLQEHLSQAVDEGGEARRHFLRIRIGAWHEQVVVSLLVRVHTQGGMLVLEVVPHVLGPVAEEFRAVDAITGRRPGGPLAEGLLALAASPRESLAAGIAALRTLASVMRLTFSPPERAAPDAPLLSVRELASTTELSLFQDMDVSRYIKTVQDRIAEGVRDALAQHGYRTDRFEQQIVNVSAGGVFIRDMSGGAVSTGEHGVARHEEGTRP